MDNNTLSLTVDGKIYSGWTSIRVTRGLEHCAAEFDIEVTEAWAGQGRPWQIRPFSPCTVAIGADTIITGYVDRYLPSYDATAHTVRIAGRSKTADLVDCMPDIPGGQFAGYTLDKSARAMAKPFGVAVIVSGDVGEAFPIVGQEKTETAFELLDRLCRMRGILLHDDEKGNLILSGVGSQSAAGALIEGQNIKKASATLAVDKRFSEYAVYSQVPLAYDDQDSHLEEFGKATDADVPRYRRHVEIAEHPAMSPEAVKRAEWQMKRAVGRGTESTVTVQGYRQQGGKLWQINQIVPVKSQMLSLDRSLLISKVSFMLSEAGSETELTLTLPEAFTPEPYQPHARHSDASWSL